MTKPFIESGNEYERNDEEEKPRFSRKKRIKDRAELLAGREVGDQKEYERFLAQAGDQIKWEDYEAWRVRVGWKFEEAYNYTGPQLGLLYKSRRYIFEPFPSKKQFVLRHREGEKWEWGAGPVRVPYNLPALLANPEREIELVEGEKGVERLKKQGLLATCIQGQNWTDDAASFFEGRTVNVAMDNDDAGRKYIGLALDALRKFGAKVRVIELPDLGPRNGLDDWIAKHCVEEYHEIVARTAIEGANIKASPFDWIDAKAIPLRDWLLKPVYIRKHTSAIIATGGTGKSFKLIGDALTLVSGSPLLNMSPEGKYRVWYWNGEDPMEELQRRFAAALKYHELTSNDLGGRLFIDSGRRMPIKIASDSRRTGLTIAKPVIREVVATLLENKIDVLMIIRSSPAIA